VELPQLAFFSELQRCNPKKIKKMENSPLFGRDPVAHGSSGLKPLRRRALHVHVCTQIVSSAQQVWLGEFPFAW